MKRLYTVLIALIFLGTAMPLANAAARVSVDFFYDQLEPYGDWREVGDYGYCWQPRDVDRDWRPYANGRWVYTDAGWTWDSDEPFGWAVYHYGRWAQLDQIGWVWVPGTEWGPAWVSWRRSPTYVGWAPLPPEAEFNPSTGITARVDADYDIGPTYYSFVEVRNFGAPRLRSVIVRPTENITIIQQTTNITRVTYVNNVVFNEGPRYEVVSRESAQPIPRLKLERRQELEGDPRSVRSDQLRTRVEGGTLRVTALAIDPKPAAPPRKVAAKVQHVEVDHGWKNAGPAEEVTKARTKIKSEPVTSERTAAPATERTTQMPAASPIPSPGTSPAPGTSMPAEGTARGKTRNAAPPTSSPSPGVAEASPTPAEKVVPPGRPGKPGKPGKGTKAVKPESVSPRPSPTAAESTPAEGTPTTTEQGRETLRQPSETVPEKQKHGKKPKGEMAEPTRTQPPSAGDSTPASRERSTSTEQGRETLRQPSEATPETQSQGKKSKGEKARATGAPTPSAEETPAVREKHQGKGEARPQSQEPAARSSSERETPRNVESRPRERGAEAHQKTPAATQERAPQPEKEKGKGKAKEEKREGARPEATPQ